MDPIPGNIIGACKPDVVRPIHIYVESAKRSPASVTPSVTAARTRPLEREPERSPAKLLALRAFTAHGLEPSVAHALLLAAEAPAMPPAIAAA